jgi:glycine oxidase
MVPMHEKNTYRVGATYETKLLSTETTETGRKELSDKLTELLKVPFRIVSQDWGFRPTTPDRKPLLGPLPNNENIIIFNGLGTKGVSLAPYFSKHLLDGLLGKTEILPEVNINRFKSLFSKSTGVV